MLKLEDQFFHCFFIVEVDLVYIEVDYGLVYDIWHKQNILDICINNFWSMHSLDWGIQRNIEQVRLIKISQWARTVPID